MKAVPLSQLLGKVLILLSIGLINRVAFPAVANPLSKARNLLYPQSSERFLQEGHEQFEEEIQRLQNPPQFTVPLLEVDPNIRRQQQQLREEQERRFQDILNHGNYRSLVLYYFVVLPSWKSN
jgi:hypothetical protein